MSIIQIILIAIFVYLGSIGSIVGNTIGWYTLGRPLVAALVVGVILGNGSTPIELGKTYVAKLYSDENKNGKFDAGTDAAQR